MTSDYSPGAVILKLGGIAVILHLALTVVGVLIALWIWQ
jgi:hypothetical protein